MGSEETWHRTGELPVVELKKLIIQNLISAKGAPTSNKQGNYHIRVHRGQPSEEPKFWGAVYENSGFCHEDGLRSKSPYEALERIYEWSVNGLLAGVRRREMSDGEVAMMEEERVEQEERIKKEALIKIEQWLKDDGKVEKETTS